LEEAMLNVDNVSFEYVKGKKIINNFTYTFEQGKSYVICGDNGVGKTTLLKLLLGLLKPDSGIIQKGCDYTTGYVPDYNGLYENLTVMDNVLFRLGIYNKQYSQVKVIFESWLNAYHLLQYTNSFVKDLSLGTKKKVGLLCACIIMPQVLMLDEPTGGLDMDSKKELVNMLIQLKREDTIIITVTHDESFIHAFDNIVINL